MRQAEDDDSEAEFRERSRSRTPLRSCSPASSKTIIEAAIARKSNANDTNRSSFSKQRRGRPKHKSKIKMLSKTRAPEKFSKESKSRRSYRAPSRTIAVEQSHSSLDFGMAALSEKQQKSLNDEETSGGPEEQTSMSANRHPSLDLTCCETMSLDVENISVSPDSFKESPLYPTEDRVSPNEIHLMENDNDTTVCHLDSNEDGEVDEQPEKIDLSNKEQENNEEIFSERLLISEEKIGKKITIQDNFEYFVDKVSESEKLSTEKITKDSDDAFANKQDNFPRRLEEVVDTDAVVKKLIHGIVSYVERELTKDLLT